MDRVLALVIALVTAAAAAQTRQEPAPGPEERQPGLSGEWRLDIERSDDPREKMRQMRPRGPFSGEMVLRRVYDRPTPP